MHEDAEKNTVTATFDLPGIRPEEVNIDVNQNRLSVSGETSSNKQRDEAGYTVRERCWGKFSRTLMLPQGTKVSFWFKTISFPLTRKLQSEDVKAKMENGVLNVTFPKAQPQQPPKRVTIE